MHPDKHDGQRAQALTWAVAMAGDGERPLGREDGDPKVLPLAPLANAILLADLVSVAWAMVCVWREGEREGEGKRRDRGRVRGSTRLGGSCCFKIWRMPPLYHSWGWGECCCFCYIHLMPPGKFTGRSWLRRRF